MTKIRDFIKKRAFLILNAAGALLILLCFFVEPIANLGFGIAFAVWSFASGIITLILAVVFIAAINVFAFITVKTNEPIFGILFTALGGPVGGFAAVRRANRNYAKARAVNLIFNAYIWILLYAAVSTLLYWFDYYYFPLFHY